MMVEYLFLASGQADIFPLKTGINEVTLHHYYYFNTGLAILARRERQRQR